jgi:hypothetical protein
LGVQQRRSRRVISYQPGERPNANQIIVHQTFWNADYKNQMGAHSIVAEWNAGATTSNANDYFIDQLGARMGKYHAVFDDTWVRVLPREDLLKKCFRLVDLFVLAQQLNDFAQRVWNFPGPEPKDNVFFVKEISEGDSHLGGTDLLDYPAKPVIQLNKGPWQLKIQL